MSDYFLNKIYGSLLVNKAPKTKSTFRTLSESYNLVCEEELPNTSSEPLQQPVEQPNSTVEKQPKPVQAETTTTPFNIKQSQPTEVKWSPEQEVLYKERLTGTGPGEFSVASVVTGKTDPNELAKHVSGGSLSYDVEVGNLKFEVKQLEEGKSDDVRIGNEGQALGIEISTTVSLILRNILEEYNNLPEEEKNKVNEQIIRSVPAIPELASVSVNLKGREKSNYQRRIKTNIKHRDSLEGKRTGWNLVKYVEGIEKNITELSLKLLFNDNYREFATLETAKAKKPVDSLRRQYVVMSIKELLEIINNLASQTGNEQNTSASTPTNSDSVQALKKTFKDFYGAAKNKQEELHAVIDREAEMVDKRLSKLKCKTTGEGCYDVLEFFKEIKQQNNLSTLMNLKQYLENPNTLSKIFPNDLTGLFAVNPNGYCYIPKNEAGRYMRITRISSGGKPKIAFKPESLRMSVQIPSAEEQTQDEL
jgi:hypothetical protein